MDVESLLPQVKETEIEILNVIHNFCEENNIKYSLAYGTLLGAVRHKGFIPWDDDIDIWMLREDYDRFISLWNSHPVNGFILQNTDNSPDFTQNFTKIRKNNTTFIQTEEEKTKKYHKGIFVDIFPLDRAGKNSLDIKMQKVYAVLTMLFYRKFAPPKEKGAKKVISKALLFIVPKSKYESARKHFEKRYLHFCGNENSKLVSPDTFESLNVLYDNNTMDEFVNIPFENYNFMAVKKYHESLVAQYGNYMKLPPKEERTWKHHPIVIDLNRNYEQIIETKIKKQRVQRAIIMAAGLGSRLEPATINTPKPLVSVNGVVMIESIIDALHFNNIYKIYIVIGYKKEKFQRLKEKYRDIVFIENPYYDKCNNIASLYFAKDYISNSFIIDGDQLIKNPKIFNNEFQKSGYCADWADETDEWLMKVENNKVISCSRTGGSNGWQLFGVSMWTHEDGIKLKQFVIDEFESGNTDIYWDDVAMFKYFNQFDLGIRKISRNDIIEIDNFNELIAIDDSYKILRT